MRTFSIVKNGVARIMRSYGFDATLGRYTQDAPGAADAVDLIAKWHPTHQSQVTTTREIAETDIPNDFFQGAWRDDGLTLSTDMAKARDIHADRIAVAQAAEIARLKVEERKERLKSNTTKADDHAATIIALEALNLNVLATQIAVAPNPTALKAIWPAQVPKS